MEAAEDVDTLLSRLMRVPPRDFVAERTRIVRALRAQKRRDAAAVVAAVRRPAVADWAFNVLAAEHSEEVERFVISALGLQRAQAAAMAGRDAGDLRDAVREVRDRSVALVTLALPVATAGGVKAGASVADLTSRLAEIAHNPAALEMLRLGHLGLHDPGDVDPFDAADAAPTDLAGARQAAAGHPIPDDADRLAEVRRQHVRALAAAERVHARAAQQASTAASRSEAAAAAVARCRERVEEARAQLDLATTQLDRALAASDVAERARSSAADALSAADEAVQSARRAVDADSNRSD